MRNKDREDHVVNVRSGWSTNIFTREEDRADSTDYKDFAVLSKMED